MKDYLDFADICKKLQPFLGKRADDLFLEYSIAETREEKLHIYQLILALYRKYIDDNFLDQQVILKKPPEGMLKASYALGKIEYPNKKDDIFGLREQDFPRHLCISGMSGSGKTTFAIRIINELIRAKKPFLVFDWKKSFRSLYHLSKDLMVFTVGKPKASNFFRLNVNRPPKGVSPDEWITILADLLCECYGASFGVHKLLSEVMQKAFKKFGVYSGSGNYPTWYQIRDRLEEMAAKQKGKSRESEWLTSALRIVHSLTFGEFGNTINDKSGYNISIEDLLKNRVVFELDALGTMEKKFFCSYILLYIYKAGKANNDYHDKFKSAIIVDEAHNIFLKQNTNFFQESVTDMIYREIREYGISLICLDQHVSKLSETVLGNSSTTIAFQQILPSDVDTISKLMFLHENKDIFTKLSIGQAIVKLTDRFYDPFLIKVEKLDLPDKIINDEELRSLIKENCLLKRKIKQWNEMINEDKLASEISRFSHIFNESRTEFQEKDIKDMIRDMQDEKEEKKILLVNHLQQEIFDTIVDTLRDKKTIKDAKISYKERKYNTTDINKAFKLFSETEHGKKIMAFLDSIHSIKNLHSLIQKTDPIGIYSFMQKLHEVNENLGTAQLYKELNISFRKGNEMKNLLLEHDLIVIREDKTAKGITKKIGFSKAGNRLMEKAGIRA